MFFCVWHHDVRDWDRFNSMGDDIEKQAPQGFKSIAYYPNREHNAAVCVWQADSLQNLRQYLDQRCSGLCANDYYQIDEQYAIGLPKVAAPA
jgi:hypothetical protein